MSLLPREAEQNGVCGKRNDQKKEPWRASLGEIICELSKGRWGKWVELMKKKIDITFTKAICLAY